MEVIANGEAIFLPSGKHRLLDLLEEIGIPSDQTGIAVAVNLELVPRSQWEECQLNDGDRVEVIAARQGG
jgi:sulfur carrier protein